ncbi:hypothetical protein BDQ12DRAFT_746328 [Crucibulum laeve]|uniref:Uncharacterized protein n=1 Tax=Crucibulum laeve TaxID=68775 RepID=A0A5C3LZI7_9AGAR|nr:hypothetical protein BDQ12DRAFT_746328 [Crucibulum laeve]
MPSQPTQPTSLPAHHHHKLICILHTTNRRYSWIAKQVRNSLNFTGHAQKRAASLGLSVDIEMARNLPQNHISVIPLPIIEIASPEAPVIHFIPRYTAIEDAPSKRRPDLRCVIPTRSSPHEGLSSSELSSVVLTAATSPVAGAPSVLRGRNVPWRGATSRWSMTSVDANPPSPLELTPVDDDEDDFDTTEDSNIPVSADIAADCVRLSSVEQWQLPDVPIDGGSVNWQLDDLSDMEASSASPSGSPSGFLTSGSASGASNGPVTPDAIDAPHVIRIKRKSLEVSEVDTFEKRPKFERKGWTQTFSQRRITIRIPASHKSSDGF